VIENAVPVASIALGFSWALLILLKQHRYKNITE
jgi:hypothetical protein